MTSHLEVEKLDAGYEDLQVLNQVSFYAATGRNWMHAGA